MPSPKILHSSRRRPFKSVLEAQTELRFAVIRTGYVVSRAGNRAIRRALEYAIVDFDRVRALANADNEIRTAGQIDRVVAVPKHDQVRACGARDDIRPAIANDDCSL